MDLARVWWKSGELKREGGLGKLRRSCAPAVIMANFPYETRLQGIMVVVFIKINIQFDNYHDSPRAYLIEEIDHLTYVLRKFD